MNNKVYKTLEYYKIINMLKEQTTSEAGSRIAHKLTPIYDLDRLELMQSETADVLNRIVKYGHISFGGIVDISKYTKRLESEGALNSDELLKIAGHIGCGLSAVKYNNSKKSNDAKDSLDPYFDSIAPLKDVHDEITRCIIGPGEIADNASPTLNDIRRKKNGVVEKIRVAMNKQLSALSDYLQDNVITSRNGRYCLSVRSEFKSRVPGMVHDQSSSGQTLFIEPMNVVDMNNSIRELELKETEEISRILFDLSGKCASVLQELIMNYEALSRLDFIFAKGKLAIKMNAMRPKFNEAGIINIKGGRHPLLDESSCVPVDIRLGSDYDLLIITGPNTGGKTVSLKTCGLLTLMAQAGLFIPAKEHSDIAIFQNVYADIGDEQSIEQSLSTFSSHMTNIVHILDGVRSCKEANHEVLCLFDELCAGTDPNEGAALAMSILDHLHASGVKTLATTHYSELKLYALNTDRVENASLEFSVDTLSPTYRLLYGIPGKSNAFAISSKLGLSNDIITSAKENMSDDNKNFEDIIIDIETKRAQIEQDAVDIAAEKQAISRKQAELDERLEKTKSQKKRILDEANEEAARILENAKEDADEAIRKINKLGKSNNGSNDTVARLEKERANLGKKAKKARAKTAIKKPVENHKVPKNLQKGDSVKVLSMNKKGTVHTLPDKSGNLQVKMGIMTMSVNIKDLVLVEEKDELAQKFGYAPGRGRSGGRNSSTEEGRNLDGKITFTKSGSVNSKSMSTSYEIKLLGLTSDEAIMQLDKYLDDAYLAHIGSVRVVHGKGTGVLRSAVHQYLKNHPHVAEYHLGEFGEGDSGVTIVRFE